MATALNGLVQLIPFGRAFSTGSRLAFGGTVAAENNAERRTPLGSADRHLSSVSAICYLSLFRPMNPVLFLNGTSSAGKTTVARQFQKLWEEQLRQARSPFA
jgi:hypothetical protein